MELNYSEFDGESKKLIKELSKENDKFNKLITKLQNSKNSINSKSEPKVAIKEELKK